MKLLFSNQKGGVGKTTLSREVGVLWALEGKKVLLVDCDAQGNLTKSLTDQPEAGLYDLLESGQAQPQILRENLHILGGDTRLAALEKRLIGEVDAYTRLKSALSGFIGYDVMILDTPPSLGVMTINALTAADYLIVPLIAAQYAMQGTNDLMQTVNKVRSNLNPGLKLAGTVIGQFDPIPVISRQIRQEIQDAFGDMCLKTLVSKTIRYEEAIALRQGLSELEGPSWIKAQGDVKSLGSEIAGRVGL